MPHLEGPKKEVKLPVVIALRGIPIVGGWSGARAGAKRGLALEAMVQHPSRLWEVFAHHPANGYALGIEAGTRQHKAKGVSRAVWRSVKTLCLWKYL